MKNLSNIVQSCYDFYAKNVNMSTAFREVRDLQSKCDKFVYYMYSDDATLSDLNNSLDSMVLCDEFMEALAYTYSDEMNKQLEAFSEEGMVEHGLGNIKYGSESYGEYVRKLNILSAKAKEIVGYLKRGKTDLSNMRGYVKDIEEKYENVITTVYEKNYCTEDGRRYTKKVLNNRIAGRDEVLKYINDADSKIDKVIKYYTNLIGVIENEKEICDDLHKLTNNEVKVNLFDNLK